MALLRLLPVRVLLLASSLGGLAAEDGKSCTARDPGGCAAVGHSQWLAHDPAVSAALGREYGACDFERVDASSMSPAEFKKSFQEQKPVILTNLPFLKGDILSRWQKEAFLAAHGQQQVQVRRNNAISDYSNAVPIAEVVKDWSASKDFVLDFTHGEGVDIVDAEMPAVRKSFLAEVLGRAHSTSLSLGPSGVGAAIHRHPETWLALLHGEKHWFFYKPGGIEALPRDVVDMLGAPYTLPQDILKEILALEGSSRPMQCTQKPGEVMYFPSLWDHGTINIGEAVGFGLQRTLDVADTMMKYYAKLAHKVGESRYCRMALWVNKETTDEKLAKFFTFVKKGFWSAPLTETYMQALLQLESRTGDLTGLAGIVEEPFSILERAVAAGRLHAHAAADAEQQLAAHAAKYEELPEMKQVLASLRRAAKKHAAAK